MVQLSSSSSKQRSERRIAVRLPLKVSGRDPHGVLFEEETASENLCRNGAAFVTRLNIPVGCDLLAHVQIVDPAFARLDDARQHRPLHEARCLTVIPARARHGDHVALIRSSGEHTAIERLDSLGVLQADA